MQLRSILQASCVIYPDGCFGKSAGFADCGGVVANRLGLKKKINYADFRKGFISFRAVVYMSDRKRKKKLLLLCNPIDNLSINVHSSNTHIYYSEKCAALKTANSKSNNHYGKEGLI